VEHGATLAKAVEDVLDLMGRDYDADVGLIAVDTTGNPVAMHRTRDMPHAFFFADGPVVSRMRV
jgi:isoaspartyl peptidase/L-asparaginase-like protein (Ntn-hydrolase superfamily)